MIETNPQISIYEEGEWIEKGQYKAAVSFDEDVKWIKKKRNYTLQVCYVRHFYILQYYLIFILHQEEQQVLNSMHLIHSIPPDTQDPTPVSASTSHFPTQSGSTHSPFKQKMITALNIPVELTDHRDVNLGYAWKKYKACLAAVATCNLLWEDRRLRDVFDWKPTQADIISVFKGKTQWHLTYAKAFPKLTGYPEMVSWLEDSDDKPSDIELWGVFKSTYTFSDLLEWLANGGVGLKKIGAEAEAESEIEETQKGKGKEKAKEKRKGKGKEKEMEKEKAKEERKEKRKEKEMEKEKKNR